MKANVPSFLISFFIAGLFLSGCKSPFYNLTPEYVPANPSGVYTLNFSTKMNQGNIIKGSKKAGIVIDGRFHSMRTYEATPDIFYYDYKMPPGTNHAKYYYVLEYDYIPETHLEQHVTKYSGIYHMKLINQYILRLESVRGPVGANINLVGRSFSPKDQVYFGGQKIKKQYISPTTLRFQVPLVPTDKNYEVTIRTREGNTLSAGQFRVDLGKINVSSNKGNFIQLNSGEVSIATFDINSPAPQSGLSVEVTTDVPKSVIMSEVNIPAGQSSINVEVRGGSPGKGSLFIQAPGFEEVNIPVTVM